MSELFELFIKAPMVGEILGFLGFLLVCGIMVGALQLFRWLLGDE